MSEVPLQGGGHLGEDLALEGEVLGDDRGREVLLQRLEEFEDERELRVCVVRHHLPRRAHISDSLSLSLSLSNTHSHSLSLTQAHAHTPPAEPRSYSSLREKTFFIHNLMVRIHLIIQTIWWTGLALWEFELPF